MKSKNTILRNIIKGEMSLEDESTLKNNNSIAERQKQEWDNAKDLSYSEEVNGEKILHSVKLVIWGQNKVIPFIIVRTLPNGKIEHWKLSELEIIN